MSLPKIKNHTQLTYLTSEEEKELIHQFKKEWFNTIFNPNGPPPLNKKGCEEGIEWIYRINGLEEPIIFFLDSPLACQIGANLIGRLMLSDLVEVSEDSINQANGLIGDRVRSRINSEIQLRVGDQVWGSVWSQFMSHFVFQMWEVNQIRIWNQVRSQITGQMSNKDSIEDDIWIKVWKQILVQMENQIEDEIRDVVGDGTCLRIGCGHIVYFEPSYREFIFNINDIAFYEYYKHLGVFQNEDSRKYVKYLESYPGYVIFLKGFAFVCGLPNEINYDTQGLLHFETGPALSWGDGYSQYYWHGVPVPGKWINEPLSITSEDFLTESNAERRRALHEILGTDRLTEILELETVDIKEVPFQTWDQEGFLEACQTGELGKEMVNFTEEEILTTPEKILPYYDLFIKTNIQTIVLLQTTDKVDGDEKASFIEVRCPSTGEIFHLGVPSDFTDASKARAWTLYEDEKIGDFET